MVIHSNFRLSLFLHLRFALPFNILCVPVGAHTRRSRGAGVRYVLVSLLCMRLVTLREGSCGWYDDDVDDE